MLFDFKNPLDDLLLFWCLAFCLLDLVGADWCRWPNRLDVHLLWSRAEGHFWDLIWCSGLFFCCICNKCVILKFHRDLYFLQMRSINSYIQSVAQDFIYCPNAEYQTEVGNKRFYCWPHNTTENYLWPLFSSKSTDKLFKMWFYLDLAHIEN